MYDMIIIGAGPAGLSSAIYGQRAGKKTLLLDEKGFGGQIVNTPEVENYPGIMKISGVELANSLYNQAKELGAEIKYEKAVSISSDIEMKRVSTPKSTYEAKSVIIATGAKNRPIGVPGEEKLTGAGVSYCATCDGAFFRGRDVAVIGGGNTALEDAEVLSGIAKKVYLIHRRDAFRAEAANVDRLSKKENVEFVLNAVPERILGETMVSGIEIRDTKTEEVKTIEVQGIFVAIGQMPDNKDFENVVALSKAGYVEGGENCLTNAEGIFVAGDCRTKKVRQLTTAAADGAVAALAAVEYINSL